MINAFILIDIIVMAGLIYIYSLFFNVFYYNCDQIGFEKNIFLPPFIVLCSLWSNFLEFIILTQEEYTELLKHVVISSAPEGGQNLEIKNLEESQTNISTAVPALSLQNSESK